MQCGKMENNSKLVSIVIPVYNEERYLHECLDSLLRQTYENIEIICVDDGSTDGSLRILQDYKERDNRVVILTQSNQFAGVARNNGLSVAKGDYILFLDSDDYFALDFIEKMLERIIKTDSDIVVCKSRQFDDQNRQYKLLESSLKDNIIDLEKSWSPENICEVLFQLTAGWAWDKIYKASFIKSKHIEFQNTRVANDACFVYIAYAEATRISFVSEMLVNHRTNVKTSLEYTRHEFWSCGLEMAYALKNELVYRGKYKTYKSSYIRCMQSYLMWLINGLPDYDFFSCMYDKLHNNAIDDLDLLCDKNLPLQDSNLYDEYHMIKKYSCGDYLMKKLKDEKNRLGSLIEAIAREKEKEKTKHWVLKEELIPKNARVVLYGYGDVGRDFEMQIKRSERLRIVAIVDKSIKDDGEYRYNDISELDKDNFDIIIISVLNSTVANEIRSIILANGIDERKIYIQQKFD